MFTSIISKTICYICCGAIISCACSKKQNEEYDLPEHYQELAIKLSSYRFDKSSIEFNKVDSLASFRLFMSGLDDFLEKIPTEKDATSRSIATTLDLTLEVMKSVLKRYAPAYRDSLDSFLFFQILSLMKSSYDKDMELLEEATLIDFISAYTKYMPEKAAQYDRPADGRHALMDLLGLRFDKPIDILGIKPEYKAFAYVRASILKKKFNSTLSENKNFLWIQAVFSS